MICFFSASPPTTHVEGLNAPHVVTSHRPRSPVTRTLTPASSQASRMQALQIEAFGKQCEILNFRSEGRNPQLRLESILVDF